MIDYLMWALIFIIITILLAGMLKYYKDSNDK